MPKKDFSAAKATSSLISALVKIGVIPETLPGGPTMDEYPALITEALQAAHDAGRTDLNGRDMIDTLDAGLVEFLSDHAGKVWLNVDGRCVFRAGHTESVKVDIVRLFEVAPGVPSDARDGDAFAVGETVTGEGSANG